MTPPRTLRISAVRPVMAPNDSRYLSPPRSRPCALALAARLLCSGMPVLAAVAPLTVANAQTQATTRAYAIPAGSLGAALNRLGSEARVLITFSPTLTAGLQTLGLQGSYTVPQALALLLAQTRLQATMSSDGSYTLARIAAAPGSAGAPAPGSLREVTVVGDAIGPGESAPYALRTPSASTKLGTPLIETPRSISVVTREQLQTQAPQSIEQALSYTAGVNTEIAGRDIRMSGATIRGFSDGSSYYRDGLKQLSVGTYGSWNDDIDELDSVEVVKGPASVLFGQGRPGGVINVVSKRPTIDHINRVGLSYGRYHRIEANADLGGALGDDNTLLYRVNLKNRDSDSTTIGSRDDRFSVAPSLRWDISPQTQLTLLGSYSRERGTPKTWWPSLFVYPEIEDLPSHTTAGDPSFDKFNRDSRAIGYEFEHRTDDGWQLTQNLRYSRIDIDYRHIYGMAVLADHRTITRANLEQQTSGKTLALDSRAQKDLRWGAVQHRFTVGVDYLSYRQRDESGFGWSVPNLDMYAPVYGQTIDYPELDRTDTRLKQLGVYTLNQLKWDRWVANASLRRDSVRTDQTSTAQAHVKDDATTGSLGLLYHFDNGVAPYVSYATSFDPVTGRQFDGSVFKPREGRQYEAGVKFQPPGSATLLTASVFDLYQTNTSTPDPDHPRYNIQTGEVRSTGLELEGRIALTPELSTLTSYTWLDPRISKSTQAVEVGRQALQTTRHTAAAWLDYRPRSLPGLMIAGGLRYRGKLSYNIAADGHQNVNRSATVADLAVAYETPRYRISLNVNNLFDKKYFSGPFRGVEREATVRVSYYW